MQPNCIHEPKEDASLLMQINLDQNQITKYYNFVYQSKWQPQFNKYFTCFINVVTNIQIVWNVNILVWGNLIEHINVRRERKEEEDRWCYVCK
jgi:hypothetical protein